MNGDLPHGTAKSLGWERWLEEHASQLLLFARQQSRSDADAQDLVQEAVMEVFRHRQSQEPPAVAQVFATIRRRAIDLARKTDRRVTREAHTLEETAIYWFDSTAEDRERTRLIEQAMRALPEIYREAVTLKIWGGLTFAEIAEALQIPANTAASRYRYGIDELRKLTREAFA